MDSYDPGRERGAAWAPIPPPLECRGCGNAMEALLFPPVSAEVHCSGWPSELLLTVSFVPVQIRGCS